MSVTDLVDSSTGTTTPGDNGKLRLVLNPAWGLLLVVIGIIVIGGITTPDFLSADNARAVLINASTVGIVAVGMTAVTLSGNFVSLGIQQSTVLAEVLFLAMVGSGWNLALAVLITLAGLLVVGFLQSVIVAAGLNPIITTLAAGSIIYGVLTVVTGGRVVTSQDANLSFLAVENLFGLPVPVYAFVIFTIVMTLVIERTTIGRRMTLVGANREAATTSGISVRRITIWAFGFLSIGVVLAGVLLAAQLGQATSSDLKTLTIDVVAAVLVGGTAIQGGEGSPLRSAGGAIIITLLTNLMLLHDLPTGVRLTVVGAMTVAVVVVLQLIRRRSTR